MMKKSYITPESRKIDINLDENIASSGKKYWISLGEVGEEEHLYDGNGSIEELIRAINEKFGN